MGTGNDLKGRVSDGATFRDQDLVIDGCNDEGAGGVPPLGGPEDIRDVRSASQRGVTGVVIGGGGLGGGGDVANEGVHLEETGYRFGVYCKSPNI